MLFGCQSFGHDSPLHGCVRGVSVCLSVCEQARTVFWARLPKLTQLMSSVNIRAGRPISLCSGTTFESAGQCLHRGYTAVCTHSPRSVATGVTEHGSRPQQALLDRKTVASRKRNINAPFSCHFAGVQYSFPPLQIRSKCEVKSTQALISYIESGKF